MYQISGPFNYCPYCGTSFFFNSNEITYGSIAWLDEAPCFKPIASNISATNLSYWPGTTVMRFWTTDCSYRFQQ